VDDFMLDLDMIDLGFLYLILEILEKYKAYKLCIFVCNRYKIIDKIGIYLVTLAGRFSLLS
jgi:hypothetical protein